MVIWKAVLRPIDVQDVEMPEGAEVLCAREQYGQPCIWFRCDPDAPKVTRQFAICGTGHAAPSRDESRYVGTAHLCDGSLILHIFERA
jgi:hypothetical protein